MSKLILIGVGPDGPTKAGRAALQGAQCVFTAARHQKMLADLPCDILPISPLGQALNQIAERLLHHDVAILASGDPLFFGIGRSLCARFGAEKLTIHPTVSSMQLAFAHFKEPWENAIFMSLHGRRKPQFPEQLAQSEAEESRRVRGWAQNLLASLLTQRAVFLFTDPHNRPTAIAATIGHQLKEIGLNEAHCRIMVAEELGSANERITHGTPETIAAQHFADLNVMIIRLTTQDKAAADCSFGLTETEIAHSRGLITKSEVRAAILHRLRLPHTGVFWDIGAGSGSVSIEAARLCPGLSVFAIERHSDEQANIVANRRTFKLAKLHLICGPAPASLTDLPNPDRVFIGGSGGELASIVETVSQRLTPGGILVASAVIASTRENAPRLFHQHGLRVETTTISISRNTYPPAINGPISMNPITIITGTK